MSPLTTGDSVKASRSILGLTLRPSVKLLMIMISRLAPQPVDFELLGIRGFHFLD